MVEELKKKRGYSRNGCKVCKKRKFKCDEQHPVCGQCRDSNRSSECKYERAIKFNTSRMFTINAKSEKLINVKDHPAENGQVSDSSSVPSAAATPLVRDSVVPAMLNNGRDTLFREEEFAPVTTRQYPGLYNELLHDASSLISDLNELINNDVPFLFNNKSDAVSSTDFSPNEEDFLIHDPVIPKQHSNQNLNDFKIVNVLENSITAQDIVNISIFFQLSSSSSHVNYLRTFVTKVHLNLMPFSTAYLHNAFINNVLIQAKKSPYLLSAILAISARYEYFQLLHNNGDEANLKIHKKLRAFYLSSCLNSLDAVLRNKGEILNNIESLLFTTLILACDFSSSTGSNWRAHLRGAKDLLLKYSNLSTGNNIGLLISKTIFSSMEMLASITVSIGGTIHSAKELNELLNLNDADYASCLGYYGLALDVKYSENDVETTTADTADDEAAVVIPNSYNMYFGHSSEVTAALKEIIISLEAIRRAKSGHRPTSDDDIGEDAKFRSLMDTVGDRPQLSSQQVLKVFSLLHRASNVYIITKRAPFLIPNESKYHPLNAVHQPAADRVPVSCYFYNERHDNWYSWYDLCHQAYVDAATLRFQLADKALAMRSSSTMAQHLVKKILSSLFFVEVKDYSEEDARELADYYGVLDDNDKTMINSLLADSKNGNNGQALNRPVENDVDAKDNDVDDDDNDSNSLEIVGDSEDEDQDESERGSAKPQNPAFVKKKLMASKYIYSQFDHRITMIQWPLLICGICAYRPIDKLIIEACFDKMISYGIGSAEMSLSKIKKNWLLHGISYGDKISDNLFWDDGDSVPFS